MSHTLKYSSALCCSSISAFFCRTSERRTDSIKFFISGNKLIILIYADKIKALVWPVLNNNESFLIMMSNGITRGEIVIVIIRIERKEMIESHRRLNFQIPPEYIHQPTHIYDSYLYILMSHTLTIFSWHAGA